MLFTEPAWASNVAVVAPERTVTDVGTVRAGLLADRVTVVPPLGAAAESATVQVDLAPDAMLVGVHWRLLTESPAGRTVTEPFAPVTQAAFPSGRTPTNPPRVSGTVEPLEAAPRVKPIAATTPPPIALAFMPVATQVNDPALVEQFSDLPAFVKALPAAAVIEARLPTG